MMQIFPMEVKDVKQLASQYEVSSAFLVPFEHESRKKEDGTPAIWYRIVLEMKVSSDTQSIVIATSRKTLRQFANVSKALEFIDSELEDGRFERVSILRDVGNSYNSVLANLSA